MLVNNHYPNEKMKPTKLIVANWKMNSLLVESMQIIKQLRISMLKNLVSCEVVICPPFTLLRDMAEKTPGTGIKLGGQNCSHEKDGPFTGEISALMLRDMTCSYVILGHSERRLHNNEGSELVKKKAKTAIESKLKPIICIGETAYERDNDLTKIIIREQLINSIPENASDSNFIIAYEPVWAIGSGKTPTNQQIQDIHSYIRRIIKEELKKFENDIKIIYGGSTSRENAKALMEIPGVDGLLVGKASLNAQDFWKMIESAN